MALFVTNIEETIRQTIEERQKNANNRLHDKFRLTDISKWLYQKQSFVRLTSNAKIENGYIFEPMNAALDVLYSYNQGTLTINNNQLGTNTITYDDNIRKSWILNGMLVSTGSVDNMRSGFNQMYSNIRNTPHPGIVDVSISNKGAFGSVREANIKYTCHNIEQLEMLEMLYMTPGVACLLEWGWSILPNGELNNYLMDVDFMTKMDSCVLKEINNRIKASGGHYDALKGVITNFKWTQRQDGGFDCETTLVSMADTFLSADTKSMSRGKKWKSIEVVDNAIKQGDEKPVTNVEYVWNQIYERLDEIGSNDIYYYENGTEKIPLGFKLSIASEASGFWDNVENTMVGNRETEYFVTWAFIEDFLLSNSLGFESENANAEEDCITNNDIIYKEIIGQDKVNVNDEEIYENAIKCPKIFKKIFPRINSYSTKIYNDPALLSGDPFICVLPGQSLQNASVSSQTIIPSVANVLTTASSKAYTDLPRFSINDDFRQGYIRNIAVNLKFIKKVYDETDTVDAFIMGLLNGISDACGQAWKFGLFVNENNPICINIVDLNQWKENDPTPVRITGYGVNSVLRNMNLDTEVDTKMKGHIMFGTNQKKGARDISTKGTIGYQFYGRLVKDITYDNIKQSEIQYSFPKHENEDNIENYPVGLIASLTAAMINVYRERSDDTAGAAKKAMNAYIVGMNGGTLNSSTETNAIGNNSQVILPVKLSFEIDGLSGLKFGNCIAIDGLPRRYQNNVFFTIVNVSHTLNDNDWSTNIETVMRVKIPKEGLMNTANNMILPQSAKGKSINNSGNIVANDAPCKENPLSKKNTQYSLIDKFVLNHLPIAQEVGKDWDPFIILAQASLESDFGDCHLARCHNNYFGYTAGKNYAGDVHVSSRNPNLRFRVFNTPNEAFQKFVELIQTRYNQSKENGGYGLVYQYRNNVKQYAKAVSESSYITESNGDNRQAYEQGIINRYDVLKKSAKKLGLI